MFKHRRSGTLASVALASVLLTAGLSAGPASAHSGSSTYSVWSKAICEEDRRIMAQSGHSTTYCKLNASGTKYFFTYWH